MKKELYLTYEINQKRAKALASELSELSADDEATIVFDSSGGSVSAAVALHYAIREADAFVIGRVTDRCQSAALLPLSACDHRVARRSARFLLHPCTPEESFDRMGYLSETLPVIRSADWQFRFLVSERSGLDMARIARLMAAETRLDGPAALGLGLVDEVVPDAYSEALNAPRQRAYALTGYRGASAIVWR